MLLITHFRQQPIQERLSNAVAKNEEENIILYIKVLGNAGHPSSFKSLTKIMPIHGTAAASLPMRIHVEAIMALRNIAKKEPRLVSSNIKCLKVFLSIHRGTLEVNLSSLN